MASIWKDRLRAISEVCAAWLLPQEVGRLVLVYTAPTGAPSPPLLRAAVPKYVWNTYHNARSGQERVMYLHAKQCLKCTRWKNVVYSVYFMGQPMHVCMYQARASACRCVPARLAQLKPC
jgi:hypothetical protein